MNWNFWVSITIMFQIKQLKKIRIDRYGMWQISVVAFLMLVIVVLLLGAYTSVKIKDKLFTTREVVVSEQELIKKELLDDLVLKLNTKKENFDNLIIQRSFIQDPSR